jgi:hypothetical protein
MPEMNALAASLLQERPAAFLCDVFQDDSTCMYSTTGNALYRADVTPFGFMVDAFYVAVAMVRPAARIEVEMWCVPTARHNCTTPQQNRTDGAASAASIKPGQAARLNQQQLRLDRNIFSVADAARQQQPDQEQSKEELSPSTLQATKAAAADVLKGSVDLGPIPPTTPLTYNFLAFNPYYYVNSNYTSDPVPPVLGATYRLRLRITPPLAEGDALAGRKQGAVYMVDVATTATIIRRPPTDTGN